jgi:hypothetical protein
MAPDFQSSLCLSIRQGKNKTWRSRVVYIESEVLIASEYQKVKL